MGWPMRENGNEMKTAETPGDVGENAPKDRPAAKYGRLLLVAAAVVVLDQITKAIILAQVPMYETIPVIPGFFNITHIQNPGGAFGFFAGGSILLRKIVFLLLSSVAAVFVLYLYHQVPLRYRWLSFGLALIFGGAIGNLIDRIRFDVRVVDFLDFHVGRYHWPSFNVADSAITVGVAIFAVHILFNRMPE
jgi:signal peptidase II